MRTKTVYIHLKSGKTIKVKYTGVVETTFSRSNGELTAYSVGDVTSHSLLTIPVANIAAIEVRK